MVYCELFFYSDIYTGIKRKLNQRLRRLSFKFKSKYDDFPAKRKICICKNSLSIASLALYLSAVKDLNLNCFFSLNTIDKNRFFQITIL